MYGLRHITNKSWTWYMRLQTYSILTLGESTLEYVLGRDLNENLLRSLWDAAEVQMLLLSK